MGYEVGLLSKLVTFDTDSEKKKNYLEISKFLAKEAKRLGLESRIINIKAQDRLPRPNVIVDFDAGRKSTVLLLTHYDIVPAGEGWKTNPFKLRKIGQQLYGRGSNDDKGAIAAAFAAMKELKGMRKKCRHNLRLVIACDEEVGGDYGIKKLTKLHRKLFKGDFALIMDSKLKYIGIGCSGVVMGYLTIYGKQGHAAYTYKTENVIHKSLPFLSELLEFKKIRERKLSKIASPPDAPKKKVFGRFSLTILKAGYKTNIIPDKLTVGFDIRVLPEENTQKVIRQFREFANKKAKKHKLKIKIDAKGSQGYFISKENKHVKKLQEIAEKLMHRKLPICSEMGGTDGRHIAVLGIPAIGFTPGGNEPHSTRESISLRELKLTKEIVKAVCLAD